MSLTEKKENKYSGGAQTYDLVRHGMLDKLKENNNIYISNEKVAREKCSPLKTMDDGHRLRSLIFCMDMAVNHSGCVFIFLPMTNSFVGTRKHIAEDSIQAAR